MEQCGVAREEGQGLKRGGDKQFGRVVHSKWMYTLLLLLVLLHGSDGADSFCQTESGQVCRQNDPATDPTIYKCDNQEPTKESKVETFTEGETIKLLAVGDKSGFGCSFEIKDTERNLTCCYIHEEREDTRGEKLCSVSKQPNECRQPGSGEYKVEELDGPVGFCKLTLSDAKLSDTGVYKVVFPFEPGRYNLEITVKVNKFGLNAAEASWLGIAVVLVLVLVILVVGIYYLTFSLKKRNKKNEDIAEEVFEQLKKQNVDGFKKALGNKHLLRLWDRNGNTIFHIAARSTWTGKMTNIVLGKEGTDVEAPLHQYKRVDIFTHLKLPWFVTLINKLFWSPNLPVLIAHLNSRNQEGDTPLMIAAAELQTDAVEALVATGEVEINLENNCHRQHQNTALHKAVAAYPAQRKKEKGRLTCCEIVQNLLKNGATSKGYMHGHTPLHTAVRKGAFDIVKILAWNNGKDKVGTSKSRDERGETALQLAVRMGEDHEDIVNFLANYDNSWKGSREEILKTVYPAVAGGHKKILRTLTDQIEWNDYSGECLMRAVLENNKTCVNYLYGRNLTPPKDNDRQSALELAKENRRDFDIGGEKEKGKRAQQIINKLTPVAEAVKVESNSEKRKGQTPKVEYMELMKKIKGKSNKEIFDEIDNDCRQLAKILQKIQDDKRKKSSDASVSFTRNSASQSSSSSVSSVGRPSSSSGRRYPSSTGPDMHRARSPPWN